MQKIASCRTTAADGSREASSGSMTLELSAKLRDVENSAWNGASVQELRLCVCVLLYRTDTVLTLSARFLCSSISSFPCALSCICVIKIVSTRLLSRCSSALGRGKDRPDFFFFSLSFLAIVPPVCEEKRRREL